MNSTRNSNVVILATFDSKGSRFSERSILSSLYVRYFIVSSQLLRWYHTKPSLSAHLLPVRGEGLREYDETRRNSLESGPLCQRSSEIKKIRGSFMDCYCTMILAIAGYPHTSQDLSDFGSFSDQEALIPVNFVEFHGILVTLHLWPARDGRRAKVWSCVNVGVVMKQ